MTIARGTRKEDRLELRVDHDSRALLDAAAHASGLSTSAFVLSHARSAAQNLLADRTRFVLPDERWDEFTALLDQEARPFPDLVMFLARPTVFKDE